MYKGDGLTLRCFTWQETSWYTTQNGPAHCFDGEPMTCSSTIRVQYKPKVSAMGWMVNRWSDRIRLPNFSYFYMFLTWLGRCIHLVFPNFMWNSTMIRYSIFITLVLASQASLLHSCRSFSFCARVLLLWKHQSRYYIDTRTRHADYHHNQLKRTSIFTSFCAWHNFFLIIT